MKRKYGSIPAVILALHLNQIRWDCVIGFDLPKKMRKKLQEDCDKKRKELVKELAGWFP